MSSLAEQVGGSRNIIGGPFGSKLTQSDYVDDGVPVIRGSNMSSGGRWLNGEFAFVSEDKVESDLRSNLAAPGDIIVTQRGTLGQVAIVPQNSKYPRYVVSQSQMAVRVPPETADRDFVYYYLLSPLFAAYVETSTIQTDVPHINLGILRNAPANWPRKDRQSQIASVLSILDHKIELNRQMNETLEAMAQAIFKDWFVDFGPARAKAEGRIPYLTPEIWDLFPDHRDGDGKPAGWKKAELAEIVDVSIGRTPPRKEKRHFVPAGQGRTWISIRNMADMQVFALDSTEDLTADAIERFRVPLVPEGTVIVSFKLTVGRVGIAAKDMHTNEAIAHLVANEQTPVGNHYLYCFMKNFDYESLGSTSSIATAVNSKSIRGIQALIPDAAIHDAFADHVEPLFARILVNIEEAQSLLKLRDLLLPKLMSGEIQLKDAENAAEAVI